MHFHSLVFQTPYLSKVATQQMQTQDQPPSLCNTNFASLVSRDHTLILRTYTHLVSSNCSVMKGYQKHLLSYIKLCLGFCTTNILCSVCLTATHLPSPSHSLSDTRLVLLLPSRKPTSASSSTGSSSAAVADHPSPTLSPQNTLSKCCVSTGGVKAISSSSKRKAGALDSVDKEVEEQGTVVSIPAHKLVLMAKSVYFHTRLSTALGNTTTCVVREHAASLDELNAMEAVVEFMYTDKLPLFCTSIRGLECWTPGGAASQTQRLVAALTVGR